MREQPKRTSMMTLDELGDVQAIRDVLARYWRGIDRCDPELVRSTYTPDAYDDHGYYKGPVDGFIDTLPTQVWPTFVGTQHFSGHIAVELLLERSAKVESYAEAHHIMQVEEGLRDLVYGLRYVDHFERRSDEWQIAHRVCTWDWFRSHDASGIELPDTYFHGPRDASDPVFRHPKGRGTRVSPIELVAKRAIYDTQMRYARGVDRCDPELVRSTYHPGAYDDHGGYQGDVEGFIDFVKRDVMDTCRCTMHKMGNSLIEVDGDEAWSETYAVAHHIMGEGADTRDLLMGVRYIDRFECRRGEWKIAHRVMSFDWERWAEVGAQAFGPGFKPGLRDGSDPVLVRREAAGVGDAQREAIDREEIYQQLVLYCRAVDRCDEALLRSVYHPDAHDDHGHYAGDVDGFIAFVKRDVQARFRCTMHKLGNAYIEVQGDVAHCESYAVGHHIRAEGSIDIDDLVMGLRYVDRFERRDGVWRIADRELRFEWQRVEPLATLDASWTHGRHDTQDPVYEARGGALA